MNSYPQNNNSITQIDISEQWLYENYPETFRKLLLDHTTRKNIIWATDSYSERGEGYDFFDEITIDKITGDNGMVIRPRALKHKEEQQKRVKDKAEVFTPSWVCNAQNNLIDEAWFGRPNVFNEEVTLEDGSHSWIPYEGKIEFSEEKGKTWRDYIRDMRLEITCGEAPYLASRYDTVTGEPIPTLNRRVGLLDRKLRVVSENTETSGDWIDWAKTALECTYGYEWQGDSLLLARESLLFTVLDYYHAKFGKMMPTASIPGLAYIISWNLWQMDGLKYVVPRSCERQPKLMEDWTAIAESNTESNFEECLACKNGFGKHIGQIPRIRDWKVYHRLNKKEREEKPFLINIPFIQLLNQ